MKNTLRTHVAAALLLLPVSAALLAPAAVAQQRAQPGVSAVSLNSSAGLGPGAVLWLRVNATPGARNASVTMGQSGVRVDLREQKPGSYTGSHTVRTTDRIDPRQLMTVHLTVNGQQGQRNFTYPPAFLALLNAAPAPAVGNVAVAPVIQRFEVRPGARLAPGRELQFTLTGQPRADASLEIPGIVSGVDLKETRPGVYQGSYTIRRADDLRAFDSAVATLRRGPMRTTAKLDLRGAADLRGGDPRDNRGDPRADNRGDQRADNRGDQRADKRDDKRDEKRDGKSDEKRDDKRDEKRAERDLLPPVISKVTPANGEKVAERQRTRISAKLSDAGSGVDAASVQLRVDGLDVTKNTDVSASEVRYREELGRGKHNAELVVRDRSGNIARTSWSFQVQ